MRYVMMLLLVLYMGALVVHGDVGKSGDGEVEGLKHEGVIVSKSSDKQVYISPSSTDDSPVRPSPEPPSE